MGDPERDEVPGTSHAGVFLAYAKEDEKLAILVMNIAEAYAAGKPDFDIAIKPWPWAPEVGTSVLENILVKMKQCAFGIFLLTPIDVGGRIDSDSTRLRARDNVVFELGLFIGKNQRQHAFMLLPEEHKVAPSDLAGIIGISYSYKKATADTYEQRAAAMQGACEKLVDGIKNVMDQSQSKPQSSAYRQPQNPGQAPVGANPAQPASPLELLGGILRNDAAAGSLTPLRDGDVQRGRLVVHGLHGVGQIVAYDPPGQQPRFVTVQFTSGRGVCDTAELFLAPKNFQGGAG
jgi:hypothetical protein